LSPRPPPATATPIVYDLSGVTATIPAGTVTLTGTFTFDPSTTTLDSTNITATGPLTILTASPDIFDFPEGAFSNGILTAAISTRDDLEITFSSTLGLTADPIERVRLDTAPFAGTTVDVTGDAVPTATPEPSALALLSAALGLFLIVQRASRRVRQTTSSSTRRGLTLDRSYGDTILNWQRAGRARCRGDGAIGEGGGARGAASM